MSKLVWTGGFCGRGADEDGSGAWVGGCGGGCCGGALDGGWCTGIS